MRCATVSACAGPTLAHVPPLGTNEFILVANIDQLVCGEVSCADRFLVSLGLRARLSLHCLLTGYILLILESLGCRQRCTLTSPPTKRDALVQSWKNLTQSHKVLYTQRIIPFIDSLPWDHGALDIRVLAVGNRVEAG
jgi:hypothetical protein